MKKLTLFIISLLPMATAADKSYTEEEKDRILRLASLRPMYAPASPFVYDFLQSSENMNWQSGISPRKTTTPGMSRSMRN